mmetsp:Transcript_17041/g.36734  ORF Transcript_17041/g.36734 Transcript_17041/m.36734 type:complete len:213 (+) Transcript_17041:3549-4187(+)
MMVKLLLLLLASIVKTGKLSTILIVLHFIVLHSLTLMPMLLPMFIMMIILIILSISILQRLIPIILTNTRQPLAMRSYIWMILGEGRQHCLWLWLSSWTSLWGIAVMIGIAVATVVGMLLLLLLLRVPLMLRMMRIPLMSRRNTISWRHIGRRYILRHILIPLRGRCNLLTVKELGNLLTQHCVVVDIVATATVLLLRLLLLSMCRMRRTSR